MISNRPQFAQSVQRETQIFGTTLSATLGDYTGAVRVATRSGAPDDPMVRGLYYARIPNGATGLGSGVGDVVIVQANGLVKPEYNLPVRIRKHRLLPQIYELVSVDTDALTKQGKTPAQYSDPIALNTMQWFRNTWDGRTYPLRESDAYTKKVVAYNYTYFRHDGTLGHMEITSASPLDHTSVFPSDETKVAYALDYHDTLTGDVGVVVTDERDLDDDFSRADMLTLQQQLPHQHCVGYRYYRLSGRYGQVDQTQDRGDARPHLHIPLPSGFPRVIKRNWIVAPDYAETVTEGIKISDSTSLKLGDGAVIRNIA